MRFLSIGAMLLDDASDLVFRLSNLQCCKIVLYFGANNSKHNFYNIVPSGVQAQAPLELYMLATYLGSTSAY